MAGTKGRLPRKARLPGQDDVLEVVEAIYDAALDPARWEGVLGRIDNVIGAPVSVLDSIQVANRKQRAHALHGVDPGWIGLWEEEISRHNYLARRMISRIRAGSLIDARELTTPEEWTRSVYFNEAFRPNGIGQVVGVVLEADREVVSELSICSPLGHDFETPHIDFLRALVPHFRRAFEVHRRLILEARAATELAAALDALPTAVLQIDRAHRVVRANLAARRLLRAGDGIAQQRRELVATVPELVPALRAVLDRAMTTDHAGRAGVLALPRRPPRRPLQLCVLPLPKRRHERSMLPIVGTAAALVVVRDPDQRPVLPAEVLRACYGVTGAEARVALLLADDRDPAECAELLGLSVLTVRDHIRSLREKLGVRRTTELVREVASLANRFPDSSSTGPAGSLTSS